MPVYGVSVEANYGMACAPLAARACIVRVEPKVQEFATLRTAIKMTALKIDGRTLIPASWIAMTKGDPRDSEPPLVYKGLFSGTTKPTRRRLTT